MNTLLKTLFVSGALLMCSQAMAAPKILTASVDRDGRLVHQDAQWIKRINLINQQDYFATYEVHFTDGYFKKAPGFCSASTTDTSDFDRLLNADVKLGGAATAKKVNVLAMMPGKSGPSGDSAQSFQLMCIR
jgi:hypothetical protein